MRTSLLLAIAAVSLSSCSLNRMYFTVATKQQVEKANVQITQLQFYNSEEIVLVRQLAKEEVGVAKGKVRIENGRQIEEVIIPGNTPGICELHDEKALRVSFESGQGKSVPFIVERRNGTVTEASHFKVGAKEWVKTASGATIGKVDYDGKIYDLVRGLNSRLMVDKEVLNKVQRDTRVAKGRKL